jgi:hypothetical protein
MYKNIILRLVLLLGLLFGSDSIFCQDLHFDKKTKDEILLFEKTNSGVLTDSIASFGILKNPQYDIYTLVQTKVLIFKRLELST